MVLELQQEWNTEPDNGTVFAKTAPVCMITVNTVPE